MTLVVVGLGALLGIAVGVVILIAARKRAADAALRASRDEAARDAHDLATLRGQLTALQGHLAVLGRYQGIVDTEAYAQKLVADAQAAATELVARAQRDASTLLADAQARQQAASTEAQSVREQVASEAKELRTRAEGLVAGATDEATRIVEAARKRAEEIAGDAYTAMRNAKEFEQTAQAMRNVIEGYGDRYVIPTFSLLDGLAEEFGFTEAGQRLKAARDRVRHMVKSGTAATCDYVEENRRETAIRFVVDAFNGKVDTILADVRHDNFGTLEQKIRDAFSVVNENGRAFRNARIQPDYLEARVDELRWAVVAHELRLKEREEQRAIKERIREEERAQREYERAMKDAEKEEDLLRKAMEKARREFEKAGDAQKAQYELQLAELADKLRAAEEKNQRALSMAQQTKTGHVYVISNVGSFGEDVFKIGLTRRLEPLDRIKELGDASVPFEFDVHALIQSTDAPALERDLHKRFLRSQVNKVNARKEFFRVDLPAIRAEVERMGCQATWTMAALCREYKETQAVERAMKSKTFEEGAWARQQLEEHDAAMTETVAKESTA